jgi:hypothetical protein
MPFGVKGLRQLVKAVSWGFTSRTCLRYSPKLGEYEHWHRLMLYRGFQGALIALLVTFSICGTTRTAVADEKPSLAWKTPSPGTAALLGLEGGRDTGPIICDTVVHYQEWVMHDQPATWRGCGTFAEGTPVVILGVRPDPLRDEIGSTSLALVRVKIPSKGFSGYLLLLNVRPKIPKGTPIELSSADLRLATNPDAAEDGGLAVGHEAKAAVVRYDSKAGLRDLLVIITEGEHKGATGWVSSLDASAGDDVPITWFSGSTIGEPDHAKIPPRLTE